MNICNLSAPKQGTLGITSKNASSSPDIFRRKEHSPLSKQPFKNSKKQEEKKKKKLNPSLEENPKST